MAKNETHYIISVMAKDRTGIIHDLSSAISELGGNLADTRQQVMHGYFSMIIYASFRPETSKEEIKKKLADIGGDTPFAVSLRQVKNTEYSEPVRGNYILTAQGPDKIGFVAKVSEFCAREKINIIDLSTTGAKGTYTMMLSVDLSQCAPMDELREKLTEFNQKNEINLLLQHQDIFKATNEIKL